MLILSSCRSGVYAFFPQATRKALYHHYLAYPRRFVPRVRRDRFRLFKPVRRFRSKDIPPSRVDDFEIYRQPLQ
jgi:hypothetical protein